MVDKSVSIALEIFALLVSVMLLAGHLAAHFKDSRRNSIFSWMLVTNIAALGCDLITWLCENARYTLLLYAANSVVFGAGYVMTGLLTKYLSCFISRQSAADKRFLRVIYANCNAAIILVILSLFTHQYFYVENGILHAGPCAWLAVLYSLVIVLMDMAYMTCHRKELGTGHTIAFLSYGLVPTVSFIIQIMGTELTVTWLGSTLTMLLVYLIVHTDSVWQLREQEAALSKAQSMLVLSQIQPHFLFNVLNCIYELCEADTGKAQQAIAEFSEYLRENLSVLERPELVPFSSELVHVKRYISLEQMRFGDAIRVEYNTTVSGFLLPALTVQPLVENAVKHGLDNSGRGINIKVSTKELPDRWCIFISDDGAGFDSKAFFSSRAANMSKTSEHRSHVGIKNVEMRLRSACGGTLKVTSRALHGTCAKIEIPKSYTGGGYV